ncbi:MAG: LPS biosynthesis glycosyltransferase, partial [Phormidesmis sp. CAN_BIN36]|nr:LPS biosynthesis glycosyltransferase [Phormidesmis sp. CAN_BIN36]
MTYAQLSQSSRPQIAVFRSLPGLGDFLCVVPALRALRAALPEAHLVYIGLPNVPEWVERFSLYISEFVEFPGCVGLPEQSPRLDRLPDFLTEMRQRKFNLAIQMHGSGVITNEVTIALGAQQTAGFFLAGHECPDANFYLPFDESESEVRRYLRLLEFLGIPAQDETLEFPISQ